jgi:hypothetical protein
MSMFQIGDIVRVLDAQEGIPAMEARVHHIARVTDVTRDGGYVLDNDDVGYVWAEEWLEKFHGLQVGDIVTIRDRIPLREWNNPPQFVSGMERYCGTKVVITHVDHVDRGERLNLCICEDLQGNAIEWYWSEWMFKETHEATPESHVEEQEEVFENKSCTLGFELEFVAPYGDNTCHVCDGEGEVECPRCGGRGYFLIEWDDGTEEEIECCKCDGTGVARCDNCGGYGYIDDDEGWNSDLEEALLHRVGGNVKADCSIQPGDYECGMEFASDVLKFDMSRVEKYVHDFVETLWDYDAYSGKEYICGLHVHARPDNGWTTKHAEKLAEAWFDWAEELFMQEFGIDEDSSRIRDYASTWRSRATWFAPRKAHEVSDASEIGMQDRYVTLNYTALRKFGTIEWRLFDGNDDPAYISKAIKWVGELVKATQEGIDNAKERFMSAVGLAATAA